MVKMSYLDGRNGGLAGRLGEFRRAREHRSET
jgi:hypothetical protein